MQERSTTRLTGSAEQLRAELERLKVDDTRTDAVREAHSRKAGGGCMITFLLGIGAFFLFSVTPLLGVVAAIAAVVVAVGTGQHYAAQQKLAKIDLDAPRLAVAEGLLKLLAEDLSPKKALSLTLQHGPCDRFGKKLSEESGSVFGSVRISEHEDDWFELSGTLTDGSVFRLRVCCHLKRKAKPKRRYTKISDRTTDEVLLSIRAPQSTYSNLESFEARLPREQFTRQTGMHIKRIAVRGPVIRLSAVTGVRSSQIGRAGTQSIGTQHAIALGVSPPQHSRGHDPQNIGMDHTISSTKLMGVFVCAYAALSHCRASASSGTA